MNWRIEKEVLNEFQELYFIYCSSCDALLGGSCDKKNCEHIAKICYDAHKDKGKCEFTQFCNMVELCEEDESYKFRF